MTKIIKTIDIVKNSDLDHNNTETRKEIKWTMGKYIISNLWKTSWPNWPLNSKFDKEWNPKIKTKQWNPEITISYKDEYWVTTRRKDSLIYVLMSEYFPKQIENYEIKHKFKNPKISHKDWNKLNTQASNLMRIDQKPPVRWRNKKREFKNTPKQIKCQKILLKNELLTNIEIARQIFLDKYIPQRHDQFVYRERKKMEDEWLISISKAKIDNQRSKKSEKEIKELIIIWDLNQQQISAKIWVSEKVVMKIRRKLHASKSDNI